MASKAKLKHDEIESNEKIARENRQQQETASKRQFAGNIISSVLGLGKPAGTIGAAFIKRSKDNDVSWFKEGYDAANVDTFVSLPQYDNLIDLDPVKTGGTVEPVTANKFCTAKTSNVAVVSLHYVPRLGSRVGEATVNSFNANLLQSDIPANESLITALNQLAKVNSRAVSFDPDLIGLYLLQCIDIAAALAWLKTNIEICTYYSAEQTTIRDALLMARGVDDPETFFTNLADLRKMYTLLVKRFNVEIALPTTNLVKRRVWLDSVILKDQNLKKACYITFRRFGYAEIDENISKVEYAYDVTNLQNPVKFFNYCTKMLDRLAEDPEIQTLIGNIRASIDENQFVKLPELTNDFVTVIDANDEVLMEFHNIKTLPEGTLEQFVSSSVVTEYGKRWADDSYLNFTTAVSNGVGLTQKRGYIINKNNIPSIYDGLVHSLAIGYGLNNIKNVELLDFYKDRASADDIIVATRLHPTYHFGEGCFTAESGVLGLKAAMPVIMDNEGTELILCAQLYAYRAANNKYGTTTGSLAAYSITTYCADVGASMLFTGETSDQCFKFGLWSNVDWGFPVYAGSKYSVQSINVQFNCINQVGHDFRVPRSDLGRIHQLCDRSLYIIPSNLFKFQK